MRVCGANMTCAVILESTGSFQLREDLGLHAEPVATELQLVVQFCKQMNLASWTAPSLDSWTTRCCKLVICNSQTDTAEGRGVCAKPGRYLPR